MTKPAPYPLTPAIRTKRWPIEVYAVSFSDTAEDPDQDDITLVWVIDNKDNDLSEVVRVLDELSAGAPYAVISNGVDTVYVWPQPPEAIADHIMAMVAHPD